MRLIDGAIAMENIMEVPQKVKTRTAMWHSNFTSGYISKRTESRDLREICILMLLAVLFTIAKEQKQPKYPLTNS